MVALPTSADIPVAPSLRSPGNPTVKMTVSRGYGGPQYNDIITVSIPGLLRLPVGIEPTYRSKFLFNRCLLHGTPHGTHNRRITPRGKRCQPFQVVPARAHRAPYMAFRSRLAPSVTVVGGLITATAYKQYNRRFAKMQ